MKFSKLKLARYLQARATFAYRSWKSIVGTCYNPTDGWAQVDGKGEAANRLYGEIEAIERIYEDFGLDDATGESLPDPVEVAP